MFHEHELFDSLTKANATLSAILAGDEIMNFIIPLRYTYGRVGLIYSMSFCVLFIVCIHNVLIFIISESFKIEVAAEDKFLRKTKKQSVVQVPGSPGLQRMLSMPPTAADNRAELSVISRDIYEEDPVVLGDDNINSVRKKVYNKIIPQSRQSHINDMNLKKQIVKHDIHYLKQSMQDLMTEQLGTLLITRNTNEVQPFPVRQTLR